MKVVVLLNQAAGTLAASPGSDEATRIRDGFASAGVEADVRSVDGKDLAAAVAEAGGATGAPTRSIQPAAPQTIVDKP